MKKVLLLGSHNDPHVSELATHVNRLGGIPFIFDATSLENTIHISFSNGFEKNRAELLLKNGERLNLCDIDSIWFRLKPIVPLPEWGPFESSAASFAQGEWRTAVRSLQLFSKKAHWINPVEEQSYISSKPVQLELASSIGFRIPDTAITNDPQVVLNLIQKHPRVIYKSLNWFTFPDQTGIMTTEIRKTDVSKQANAVKRAPGIYQQFIEKDYELRITIISNHVFSARVRTPKNGNASIDWRHAHLEDIFEKCEIEKNLAEMLLKFHKSAGLHFGTYDLIVTPKGEYFFLECNPAGQFLWLEDCLGMQIMDAIARELCQIQ